MNIIWDSLVCVHINDIAIKSSAIVSSEDIYKFKSLTRAKILKYLNAWKNVYFTWYIRPIEPDFLKDLNWKIEYIDFLDEKNFVPLQAREINKICIKRKQKILEIIWWYRTWCLSWTIRGILNTVHQRPNTEIPENLKKNEKINKLILLNRLEVYSNLENYWVKYCIVNNKLVF